MKILRSAVLLLFLLVLALYVLFLLDLRSRDTSYPVLTMTSDVLEVSIHAQPQDLLAGITAHDEKDGDITDRIIVESISRFTEPGTAIIKYAVCDNDNHVASVKRKLVYTDYTSPRFTLSSPLIFGLAQSIDIRDIIGAVDAIDGDISHKVIVTAGEYVSNTAGMFQISAKVNNSKGDKISITLPVYIEDISLSAPEILLRDYMCYLPLGADYHIMDNVISALDQTDQDLSAAIITDTNLDTDTPGIYEVHYRVTDAAGRTGHAILIVIVTDEEGEVAA